MHLSRKGVKYYVILYSAQYSSLSDSLFGTECVNLFFECCASAEEVGVGFAAFLGLFLVGNHPEVRGVVLVQQFLFVVRRKRLGDDGGCDAVGCERHPHGYFFCDPHETGGDAFSVLGRLFLLLCVDVPTVEITAIAYCFKALEFVV